MAVSDPGELHPDDHLIAICRQLLAIHHAQDGLVEQDHDAPDRGPNHGRHEALSKEFAALGAELTEAAPPTTPEGIQALARPPCYSPRSHPGGRAPAHCGLCRLAQAVRADQRRREAGDDPAATPPAALLVWIAFPAAPWHGSEPQVVDGPQSWTAL